MTCLESLWQLGGGATVSVPLWFEPSRWCQRRGHLVFLISLHRRGGRGKREGGLKLKRWLQSSIRTRDRFFLLWKLSWEKSVFSGWKCKLTSHIILMIYFMGGESFPSHCSRPQRLSLTWATTYLSNLLFHFLLLRTNPRPHGIMSSALQLCILGHTLLSQKPLPTSFSDVSLSHSSNPVQRLELFSGSAFWK